MRFLVLARKITKLSYLSKVTLVDLIKFENVGVLEKFYII